MDAQSCLTLCNPMDCSPPGSSVHEVFQAKKTWKGFHFLLNPFLKGLPFPTPGDLPYLGIKPTSPVSCIGRQIFTTAPLGNALNSVS